MQADLWLQHDYTNGICSAWIDATLAFDLRPVAGLHQQLYGRQDPIQLNVHGCFEGEPDETISLTWTAE